jgi:DnaJ domain
MHLARAVASDLGVSGQMYIEQFRRQSFSSHILFFVEATMGSQVCFKHKMDGGFFVPILTMYATIQIELLVLSSNTRAATHDTSPSASPTGMVSPYTIFGLQAGTSLDDVKRRYKQLALQKHPDRNLRNEIAATQSMICIQNAYEELANKLSSESLYERLYTGDDLWPANKKTTSAPSLAAEPPPTPSPTSPSSNGASRLQLNDPNKPAYLSFVALSRGRDEYQSIIALAQERAEGLVQSYAEHNQPEHLVSITKIMARIPDFQRHADAWNSWLARRQANGAADAERWWKSMSLLKGMHRALVRKREKVADLKRRLEQLKAEEITEKEWAVQLTQVKGLAAWASWLVIR